MYGYSIINYIIIGFHVISIFLNASCIVYILKKWKNQKIFYPFTLSLSAVNCVTSVVYSSVYFFNPNTTISGLLLTVRLCLTNVIGMLLVVLSFQRFFCVWKPLTSYKYVTREACSRFLKVFWIVIPLIHAILIGIKLSKNQISYYLIDATLFAIILVWMLLNILLYVGVFGIFLKKRLKSASPVSKCTNSATMVQSQSAIRKKQDYSILTYCFVLVMINTFSYLFSVLVFFYPTTEMMIIMGFISPLCLISMALTFFWKEYCWDLNLKKNISLCTRSCLIWILKIFN